MSKDKLRWDVYAWIGHGEIKIRESNVSLKDAKKAKEKWINKSPKHEAFIALHGDKSITNTLLKGNKQKAKPKAKSKSKSKSKSKGQAAKKKATK